MESIRKRSRTTRTEEGGTPEIQNRQWSPAQRLLRQEAREKRILAGCSRHRHTGSGRVRTRMPSDYLSTQALARMSGCVRIYQLGCPMTRRQFRAMPEDLQRLYVHLLRDKHGATRRDVREMVGEDFGLRFGEGDAQRWAAFRRRGRAE